MKKLRNSSVIAGLLALSIIFTACDNTTTDTDTNGNPTDTTEGETTAPDDTDEPGDTTEPTGEQVTIRTSITDGEMSAEMIAEFEADHPHIRIVQEVVDETILAAHIASNDVVDILRINGVTDVPKHVTQGLALDLTDYFNASELIDIDDLLPIASVYQYDSEMGVGQGPWYGLPKDWSNDYALFYNKRVFDNANVDLPDPTEALTWPEVFELAKELTIIEDDGTVVQYGLAANEWGKTEPNSYIMAQYLASAGASLYTDDFTGANFDIPAVRDFLEMWLDGVDNNIGPNTINGDQTSGGDLFKTDRIGLLIAGYWWSGSLRGDENTAEYLDDFGMLPTPVAPNGVRAAATGSATGAIIYAQSPNPDEAFEVFEWFMAGEPADDRATQGWGLPAFASKMELVPQDTAFDQQVFSVLEDELEHQDEYIQTNPYFGDLWGTFDKYVAPLYFGESSIDEAVTGMTNDANTLIQEGYDAVR